MASASSKARPTPEQGKAAPAAKSPADKLKEIDSKFQSGGELEADKYFPLEPQSYFKSSYYSPSYDFPYNPDPLARSNNYATYDEMLRDDQVKVCLGLKKDMTVNSGWQIECDREDVLESLENNLKNLQDDDGVDYSFEDAIRDIIGTGYGYGFSVSEAVYKIEDGKYALKSLKTRPPHTWEFHLDDKGKLKKLVQNTTHGPQEMNPKNFLHYVYQPEWGNPYGKSDLQSAHEAWKAKKFFTRMYAMYGERFATPTIIARYKPRMDTQEIDRLYDVAQTLQNNTTILIPEDATIELLETKKDGSDTYEKAINLFDLRIGRALLVPDLLGVSGAKTDGGSFALGKKHFDLFLSTILKDRASLERKINLRIVKPLVEANFGKDIDATFRFKPWKQEDVLEYLKIWIQAATGTIFKPTQEQVDFFSELVGFPKGAQVMEKTEIDPMTGLPKPPAAGKPGQPGAKGPEKDQEGAAKPAKEGEEPSDQGQRPSATSGPKSQPEKRRQFSRGAGELRVYRDLTAYEQKVDFAAIRRTLDSREATLTGALERATRQITKDLTAQIRDKRIITKFKPERINEIEPHFMRDMNRLLLDHFTALFKDSVQEARDEVFPEAPRKFVEDDLLPEEFLKILSAESFKTVGDYTNDMTKRATNRLVRGIKDGLGERELVDLIDGELADATERWIATTVRTKTTEIYNSARKVAWESDPQISQIVEAYEFSAIIDAATSEVCESLDGRIFSRGEFTNRVTPPLHYNCRSIFVPVTKFEPYKADPKYVRPGREPSLEALVKRGGNLIAAERG